MEELVAHGVHLHADQLGQELRDPERGQELNAWTTPRTWVASEVVTASIMNLHVRDNLKFLYGNGAGGYPWLGGLAAAPTVDGNWQTIGTPGATYQAGAFDDWLLNRSTVQLRCLAGFRVLAVNGATAINWNGGVFTHFSDDDADGGTFTLILQQATTVGTGYRVHDSGWRTVSPADNWGVYLPAYKFEFTTAAPSIDNLRWAILLRVI